MSEKSSQVVYHHNNNMTNRNSSHHYPNMENTFDKIKHHFITKKLSISRMKLPLHNICKKKKSTTKLMSTCDSMTNAPLLQEDSWLW